MPVSFNDRLKSAVEKSRAAGHRLLLVIAGDQQRALRLAESLLSQLPLKQPLVFDASGSTTSDLSSTQNAKSLLGSDTEAIIFNAWGGFDPDAFGILSGTVIGGGLFVLITPALDSLEDFADPEKKRLAVYPLHSNNVDGRYLARLATIIRERIPTSHKTGQLDCRLLETTSAPVSQPQRLPTGDQQNVIDAIISLTEVRDKPAVMMISADRGRGKSSALGIAAAHLLQSKHLNSIIVSAPSRSTLRSFFHHATIQAEKTQLKNLNFIAPDALLADLPPADLLMIDEAAAIPLPLLAKALDAYPRIVFSSTLHGYEGAGRGFALRFKELLNRQRPDWQSITLKTPVRYAADDPLENFTDKLLMLDAELPDLEKIDDLRPEDCAFRQLSADRLLSSEDELRNLFALLIQAHYQTRPLDLRHLLDGPNLSIHILEYQTLPVAAVLLASEGLIGDAALRDAIVHGERRPRGHLLPQLLAYQYMQAEFLEQKTARIVRIAVHPQLQHRGFGSRLLNELQHWCEKSGYHSLGSVFGMTTDLLAFWRKNGYQPLHLGSSRNASSAAYSALVFKPLGEPASALATYSRHYFVNRLGFRQSHRNTEELATIINDKEIGAATDVSSVQPDSDKLIQAEIESYVFRGRDFETAHYALSVFFGRQASALSRLPDKQKELIDAVVSGRQDFSDVCRRLGISGRKHAEALIKDAIEKILAEQQTS
ncbi:MAG: tRNA(Met) cytidine acetyltransferase [Gammaproteobacteria bacterium]|nr:tRNA(Met) cytidine acetyltransferase [Gammaproteobacteria bacterium]